MKNCACLVKFVGRPSVWTPASENPLGVLFNHYGLAVNRTECILHLRQGLSPGYIGMKLTSSMILVEPSGSKAALNNHRSVDGFGTVTTTWAYKSNSCVMQLHLQRRGWTNCHPCPTTGMMQDYYFLQVGATWDIFYLRELLCRREEVLSEPRTSSF